MAKLPTKPENINRIIQAIKDESVFEALGLNVSFRMSDFIETGEFDLSSAKPDDKLVSCGTSACIGGHVALLKLVDSGKPPTAKSLSEAQSDIYLENIVAEFFGITKSEAHYVCYGDDYWDSTGAYNDDTRSSISLNRITKDMAIAGLELLRDTGSALYTPPDEDQSA